jgi:hypothetical protein
MLWTLSISNKEKRFITLPTAWNIVERKLQYPDEPLPDPQYLRKDFDTCVLESK